MEEVLNIDKYYLIDYADSFWSGIDEFNEVKKTDDYIKAITFDTLDEAKRFKETLKEDWGEDFDIVKAHFEYIE